jgi:hypothetical protein
MADQVFDPDKFLAETAPSAGAFDPDKFLAETEPAGKPEVGGLESFGRGAAQMFGLGYSPQVIAALKTGSSVGSDDPAYTKELAKQKAATEQAWEQHPWLYGSGMVASAIPSVVNAVFGGPEELAAAGTIGLGSKLLAESGNIGSLSGAGLRALAGSEPGLASSALRRAAAFAENPIAQGAVFGSSEGDTAVDKATGAVTGALGAKYAPAVLSGLGTAVKAVGSKVAPDIADPIFSILTNNKDTAIAATNLANDLKLSLPGGAISESKLQNIGQNLDIFNQVPEEAAKTLGGLGNIVSNYVGKAEPKDTGEAVRNAVQSWVTDTKSPTSFASQMKQIYAPIDQLARSPKIIEPTGLATAVRMARNTPMGQVLGPDLDSTLRVVAPSLNLAEENGGLTFAQMKALRQVLSDKISWNQIPGNEALNQDALIALRKAVTQDMTVAASKIGDANTAKAFADVNANASKLYGLRDSLFKIVGNPNASGSGVRDSGAIYKKIIDSASSQGGGNIADLANLKNVVSTHAPDAWGSVQKTYAANMAPNGQFSYNNFNKFYDDNLHPVGKNLLFGDPGSAGLRDTLDKISAFGHLDATGRPLMDAAGKPLPLTDAAIAARKTSTLGPKLDALASKTTQDPLKKYGPLGAAGAAGVGAELALTGFPIKTIGAGAAGYAAGKFGSRNVAAPATSRYSPSKGEQVLGQAIQKAAPMIGAQTTSTPLAVGAAKAAVPFGVQAITNQLPSWLYSDPSRVNANGRYGRKHGGRVSDKLVMAVDRAKKNINNDTKSLLGAHDNHVAQALEIANRNLEG